MAARARAFLFRPPAGPEMGHLRRNLQYCLESYKDFKQSSLQLSARLAADSGTDSYPTTFLVGTDDECHRQIREGDLWSAGMTVRSALHKVGTQLRSERQ